MQEDKAKHPHSLLSWVSTHTRTHIHIDTLGGVTGRHILGVSQQAGIPGQQRRDNVIALLVNLLFYPVSGPQSVKGVCLWLIHTPHMHTVHTHAPFHRPLCLSQPVRRQRLKTTHKWQKMPIDTAASVDKRCVCCVDASEFSGTRKCATLTDRM